MPTALSGVLALILIEYESMKADEIEVESKHEHYEVYQKRLSLNYVAIKNKTESCLCLFHRNSYALHTFFSTFAKMKLFQFLVKYTYGIK